MQEKVYIKGVLEIYNKITGELLVRQENLIVNAGLNLIRDLVSNLVTVPDPPSHLAAGSGNTAVSASDTQLSSQLGDRMAATITEPSDYNIKYAATSSPGEHTGTWYECGIFNAATSGTMLCRVVFGALSKGSLDTFAIEYTISFADDGV
jgi:hypothetical protein